jgi:hypothetical protein
MVQRGRKSRAQLSVIPINRPVLHRQPAVTSLDRPPPPDHLGAPERLIWEQVFEDYDLSTRAAAAVLATASKFDREGVDARRSREEGQTAV